MTDKEKEIKESLKDAFGWDNIEFYDEGLLEDLEDARLERELKESLKKLKEVNEND